MKTNALVIARRYAKAYDETAKTDQEAKANLEAYKNALNSLKEAGSYIQNPTIPFEVKEELLAKILTDKKAASFIKILVSSKRFDLAGIIEQEISNLLDIRLGVKRVTVTTALAAETKQKSLLDEALGKYFKSGVAVSYQEDETLLAGLIVRQGDLRIDGSAKGRIKQLSKNLTEK